MLAGLDALVFDMQDVGARYYTYPTTMAYAMEAAAANKLDFYVLDRPDPDHRRARCRGRCSMPTLPPSSPIMPLPVRHGMTMGELARLFNAEKKLGAELHVVTMRRYQRTMWFDQTGFAWVPPSPNLRKLEQAVLYPGRRHGRSAPTSASAAAPTRPSSWWARRGSTARRWPTS